MEHRRSPALLYPQDMAPEPLSIHTAPALRHAHPSIPTLLAPLRSISNSNTPLPGGGDDFDDFQSNAWINAPSSRTPLAGLGITYLRDATANPGDQPLIHADPGLRMQVDGNDPVLSLSTEIRGTGMSPYDHPTSFVSYNGLEAKGLHHTRFACDFVSSLSGEPAGHMELGLDIDPAPSETIGLIPDVNMYDKLRRLDLPRPGVNPLDTIRNTPFHDAALCCGGPAMLTPEDRQMDDLFASTDPRLEQTPSPRVIRDIMSILVQPTPESLLLPWSSANSPSILGFSPLQLAATRSPMSNTLEQTNVPGNERFVLTAPGNLEHSNGPHSSPVLNAHLGIELSDLISRAEQFRAKHPERDIDRAWLSHFAGKLSERGELLNDFRCYVVGCDQRNKRRDHILVHVGAHIGQRPFACSLCPLRFLRKNECKRHEASHSGFRPYSCDICGQSFVRQDLVRRHVKRTHGLRDENHVGATKQARKRARLQ